MRNGCIIATNKQTTEICNASKFANRFGRGTLNVQFAKKNFAQMWNTEPTTKHHLSQFDWCIVLNVWKFTTFFSTFSFRAKINLFCTSSVNGNRNWNRVEMLFVLQSRLEVVKKNQTNKEKKNKCTIYFLFDSVEQNHTFIKTVYFSYQHHWEKNWNRIFSAYFRLMPDRDVCFSCAWHRHRRPKIPACTRKSFVPLKRNRDLFVRSSCSWYDANKHNLWANFYYDPSLSSLNIALSFWIFFNYLFGVQLTWEHSKLNEFLLCSNATQEQFWKLFDG